MRIDIVNEAVQTKSGIVKKGPNTGKPYSMREQEGVLVLGQYDMRPVRVPLRDQQEAYAKGSYHIAPSSFVVGSFGDLAIGRLALVPVAKAAAAPQPARVAG